MSLSSPFGILLSWASACTILDSETYMHKGLPSLPAVSSSCSLMRRTELDALRRSFC